MGPDAVVDVLRKTRILYATESDLQDAVEVALRRSGLPASREARLNARSRIDFLVGDVGVECKVDGAWRSVARQLERYATFDEIGSLVLVTTRHRHSLIAPEMKGKPVVVHRVGFALL